MKAGAERSLRLLACPPALAGFGYPVGCAIGYQRCRGPVNACVDIIVNIGVDQSIVVGQNGGCPGRISRYRQAAGIDLKDSTTTMRKVSGIGRRRLAAGEESSEAYKARRQEIADAAVRVFNRVGLQRATLKAVADELGVDRASLYYYISSKEALFDEIVKAVVSNNLLMINTICESNLSPRRKLRDLICVLMSSYGEHYPVFYIYIRENLSNVDGPRAVWSREMRDMNRQTVDAVIAIIEQGYADKSFRNVGSPRVVAYGVLGIIGWTHRWFRPGQSDVSAEEIGKTYAEMILAGIESPY